MQEREYVVTLHKYEDLDSFYDDMETPGGSLFIPDRAVPVKDRRPVSRNTHYRLTDEEASLVRQDSRVMAVELSLEEAGLKIQPSWTQSSTFWNKSNSVLSSHKNWGLLRSVEGQQRSSWGSNGINNTTGEINVTASGKYVDVVIVDGHMNPDHPEFAVNADGSGGSRVSQYNWFELNPTVIFNSPGTYAYGPYVDPTYPDNNGDGISDRTTDNDHGTHVAGTAVGNTQGWARDATIYNISPYSSSPTPTSYFIDYIKVWHRNKEINPLTGNKNPTITNHSYGVFAGEDITGITSLRYRGTIITGPFTSLQLSNYGIFNSGGVAYINQRNIGIEQDLIDLMAEGVIVVGAAGNLYSKIANETSSISDDYNNYFVVGSTAYFYLRGTITSISNVICVGSIGSFIDDSKFITSNCGPRIDVYAPGRHIMSSVNSNVGIYSNDVRNTAYHLTKKSGTSMASPQVAGVLACLAETWPRLNQTQAVTYIQTRSKTNQITAGTGGPTDYTDLQGSVNRFLYFYKERPDTGQVGPKVNQGLRPSTGLAWPRPKIYRYGR
jgi:subtilisin family serine protease